VTYRPDLSDTADYYPLYAPSVIASKGLPGAPATWLVPYSDPPAFVQVADPGLDGQVNLEFLVNAGPSGTTNGTATNLWLGTIAFETNGPPGSATQMLWSVDGIGNIFMLDGARHCAPPRHRAARARPRPAPPQLRGLPVATPPGYRLAFSPSR